MDSFIVYGVDNDLYRTSYFDIKTLKNASYISNPLQADNLFLKIIHKVHVCHKLNRLVNLPFKRIWYKRYARALEQFPGTDRQYVVIFSRRHDLINGDFTDYLREKYPEIYLVCFFNDLVSKCPEVDINDIKAKFDMVLSFDQNDSRRYNLLYYPLVYSEYHEDRVDISNNKNILFVGAAKDRLSEIIEAYRILSSRGFECDFYICGTKRRDRVLKSGIKYITEMPYLENLKKVKECGALLEIMQHGGHGFTLRMCEAIAYRKQLITNNPEAESAEFYNPAFIHTFHTPEELAMIDQIVFQSANYQYIEALSPRSLLEYIKAQSGKGADINRSS